MNNREKTLQSRHDRGFVFLFAALVGSVLLAVGLSFLSLSQKEQILSSTGRESMHAFFAADGGGECALLWDLDHPGFSRSVFPTSSSSVVPGSGVRCNSQDIASSWVLNRSATAATTTFSLTFANSRCVTVSVAKTGGGTYTAISSRGYNTCSLTDPKRTERALRIVY